ncbi:hypothetical protein PR202_gb29220 [Eleusine coracana subsp. coracana]|uniref:Uncharacterized protein n=1 Tax=Eleusine coracana subsp. coracana TaxID=191504 RepID=A0AAV5FYV8_ELECO|nr:hypothetical protein PR202_gb29220 [Eleusine coracana subsp. coracana]
MLRMVGAKALSSLMGRGQDAEADCRTKGKLRWLIMYHKPTTSEFPTDITKMLKYGANIIQAVGYFDANYIISVAFMKNLTSFSAPTLDDYAPPVNADPAGR